MFIIMIFLQEPLERYLRHHCVRWRMEARVKLLLKQSKVVMQTPKRYVETDMLIASFNMVNMCQTTVIYGSASLRETFLKMAPAKYQKWLAW